MVNYFFAPMILNSQTFSKSGSLFLKERCSGASAKTILFFLSLHRANAICDSFLFVQKINFMAGAKSL